MMQNSEWLTGKDFDQYGADKAKLIAQELNQTLASTLNDAEQTMTESSPEFKHLQDDMKSAPHLYLSDEAIKRLGLVTFDK